ncbi:MAG: natural resistance-associated macrophage protein [Candidatus Solibacter sp.]|nr:natural resistance-associated macrophage protein [Candidatus Solibacter sp.]
MPYDSPNSPQTTGQPPAATSKVKKLGQFLRSIGLGVITGAADDDPSAIGTYSTVGATLGPGFLWLAPAVFPMMFTVVYLSSKLGQVSGRGLFDAIRVNYPKWVLYSALGSVMIGNVIEAAADIGGIAAGFQLLVPLPIPAIVVGATAAIVSLQFWGSYQLIKQVFQWLALALLAYVAAAILAKPNLMEVIKGTFVPKLRFDEQFLSLAVAVIGTSLSAYLYTWQSNEEVEEEIAMGRVTVRQRRGATDEELQHSRRNILFGMTFSNVIMYFIMLSTSATLYKAGIHEISSAADAAKALRPLAGNTAGLLFAIGIVAVGFLAVPVMTTGAAYDLAQTMGWKSSLNARPGEARKFYAAIAVFSALAMSMNFIGVNPMKALVWAGIVQGFSAPALLFLILQMTNSRRIMGARKNGLAINVLGAITSLLILTATIALIITWVTKR